MACRIRRDALVATLLFIALVVSCAERGDPPPQEASGKLESAKTGHAFSRTPSGFIAEGPQSSVRVALDGRIELAARGATLTLQTVDMGGATPSAVGTAIEMKRAHAVEVVRRISRGLEQAWRYEARPPHEGALDVRVSVSGAVFQGIAGDGLHFVDERTGARFRYGFATWIDANGLRTRVPTTLGEDGSVEITVGKALLAASTFPALLDPEVEVVTELDPDVVYTGAPQAQYEPDAASDGSDALVVWFDDRDARRALFAAAVAGDGRAYQRANVHLGDALFSPRVVYLTTESNGDRRFAVVVSNQFELVAHPITLGSAGDLSIAPAVTLYSAPQSTGTFIIDVAASPAHGNYLVLSSEESIMRAQLFSFQHTPLSPAETFTTELAYPHGYETRVAFGGSNYIVAARVRAADDLQAHIVSPVTARETGAFLIASLGSPRRPSIAHNGTSTLITWEDSRTGVPQIWGRRASDATVIGAAFPVANTAQRKNAPRVLAGDATADDFFVLWRDTVTFEDELYGGIVNAANTTSATGAGIAVTGFDGVRVGGAPLAIYSDGPDDAGGTDLWTIDFTTTWETPRRLAEEANSQANASVGGATSTGGLIAWTDSRGAPTNADIYAVVVDAGGQPTSPVATLSTDPQPEGDTAVALGNGESVVVWRQGSDLPPSPVASDIMAALVDSSGNLSGPLLRVTGGDVNSRPKIIYDGSGYLVTWQTGRYACEASCTFFADAPKMASLSSAGGVLSLGSVTTAPDNGLAPDLARSPNGNLLWVWERRGDIHGARISQGVVGPVLTISSEPGRQSNPVVAMDDDVAIVAYEDDRNGGSQIFVSFLGTDGAVTSPGSVSGAIAGRAPTVVDADDRYSFLVAWEGSEFGAPESVWGAWVKKNGVLADPSPRRLTSASLGASRRPDIVSLGASRSLLCFDTIGAERSPRVHSAIIYSGQGDGTTCDAADDCASRFCADQVCCSESCADTCRACGSDGVCQMVVNDVDDSCFDNEACNASGECKAANGQPCDAADPGSCASGFCVDGVCCESSCDGLCDKCAGQSPGVCRTEACGNFSCAPDKTCHEVCTESRECLQGFQCVDGDCVTPPDNRPTDASCGCTVPGEDTTPNAWWLLVGFMAFLRREKRSGLQSRTFRA